MTTVAELKHQIPELKDGWDTAQQVLASSAGGGSHKRLTVNIRFDGYGNSIVRFTVTDHDRATEYEKFDAAVYNYNRLP
jgi:hypothetical protein